MRRCAQVLFLATLLLAGAGLARAQSPPVPFGQYFRVEWQVAAGRGGRPELDGYVYSDYGLAASNMRLLVETLDASGQSVASTVGYVDSLVPPFGRTYFTVRLPAPGASYRVTVTSFFLHNGVM
ncbi:MAG: hypothetical protein HYV93_25285 [Candidatus Rokubacteria bacterium]|nr:hypothetical protein [Candidatus Rokubacteria bacterium]